MYCRLLRRDVRPARRVVRAILRNDEEMQAAARRMLDALCDDMDVPEFARFDASLMLWEACGNIRDHGDPLGRYVDLHLAVTPGHVVVVVRYDSDRFDDSPRDEPFSEHGRGLLIIHRAAEDGGGRAVYRFKPGEVILVMDKRF
jgi:hypothetical protein